MHATTAYLKWSKYIPSGRHGPTVCPREEGDCWWTDVSTAWSWTYYQGESRRDVTYWASYGSATKIRRPKGLKYLLVKTGSINNKLSLYFCLWHLLLCQVCRDAQAESNMEQTFQKLQQGWEARLFQLDKFTLPVWQHCEPQHGLMETEKPTEGTVSNLQTSSQHSCNDARFTIIGETE